jgi:hypothetical protein
MEQLSASFSAEKKLHTNIYLRIIEDYCSINEELV